MFNRCLISNHQLPTSPNRRYKKHYHQIKSLIELAKSTNSVEQLQGKRNPPQYLHPLTTTRKQIGNRGAEPTNKSKRNCELVPQSQQTRLYNEDDSQSQP
ncbi:hypothetical protein P8452_50981 [Trifolium repens]|nr:hypothetical protein P8452_50981 [Trifolium repens]